MASQSVFQTISGGAVATDRVFVVGPSSRTYGDLLQSANRIARLLKKHGVAPGSRVAICLDQGFEYVASLLGVWQAGAVSVLLAPDWTDLEKERVLRHSGARLLLSDVLPSTDARHLEQIDGLDAAMFELGGDQDAESCQAGDAVMIYTSGTTGEPKGVVLTESGISANVEAVAEYLAAGEGDRVPIFTPTSYTYSLSQNLVQAFAGGEIFPVPSGLMFPMDVLHSVRTYGLTGISATPTAFRMLCNLALDNDAKFDSVRFVMCGGQSLDLGLVRLIESIFPSARVVNMYGCTENSPRIAYHYIDDLAGADEQGYFPVGSTVRGTMLRIVRDGAEVPAGEIGEVVVGGSSLMRAYWRDADSTRERLRENWFYTRDLGFLDPRGLLHLTGRQSTIINIGNEKVSPEEVEKILLGIPGVIDAAVYGRPDRLLGESVEAQVVLQPGASTLLNDIQRHCRARISGFKVPRRILIVDTIPRTLYGKIDRARLRDKSSEHVTTS